MKNEGKGGLVWVHIAVVEHKAGNNNKSIRESEGKNSGKAVNEFSKVFESWWLGPPFFLAVFKESPSCIECT